MVGDHPLTAQTLAALADLSLENGDLEDARNLFERALAIHEAAHREHPQMANIIYQLSFVLVKQGNRAGAQPLCERALAKVRALREELEFELEEIVIDGSPELEARYRELIPVVEIDGQQVFTYYVHEDAFRRRLGAAQTGPARPSL